MKIYTKSGDDGTTGLYGGGRVWKGAPRVSALGEIDELNAAVGLARCKAAGALDMELARIQNWLFDAGSEVGVSQSSKKSLPGLGQGSVGELEQSIDAMTEKLEPLRNFILPGGSDLSARLHFARSVCRRAERSLALLSEQETIRPEILTFFNRLSDWLFVAARTANADQGVSDIVWQKQEER